MIVKYAGDDKLYVPVEQFELLQKYTGGEGAAPKVNKLGGSDWLKTKAKVKASVEEIAQKLLETYAKREAGEGMPFPPTTNGSGNLRTLSLMWRPRISSKPLTM